MITTLTSKNVWVILNLRNRYLSGLKAYDLSFKVFTQICNNIWAIGEWG